MNPSSRNGRATKANSHPVFREVISLVVLFAGFAACAPTVHSQPPALSKVNLNTRALLEDYQTKEIAAAKAMQAFHDFQFTDRIEESGIRFVHHAVDDAAKNWKPAHYDHGSGVAVADVDGDGLLDIYFVNQLGGCQLWRNLGGGKFADLTDRAGVALKDRICVAAAFADVDNDGLPDLFVTTVRMGNVLFKNLGNGRFKDISKEAGVDYIGHSSGATFFDFDNDGLLDLFVANVGVYTGKEKGRGGFYLAFNNAFRGHLKPERREQSLLYKNLGGGKFKNVTEEMQLGYTGWTGDATFCDVNQDGFPDLYVLNMQGDNHFYENVQGQRFVDKTSTYFPKTPWGAMGIKFFDFNQDGLLDLFLTDMHSDMTSIQTKAGLKGFHADWEKLKSDAWCSAEWGNDVMAGSTNSIFGNAFWLNQGAGKFKEVSDSIGAETYWPWGISVGDLNADGYEDVFITQGMGYPFRYGVNSLLLNEGGKKFFASAFVLGVEPRKNGKIETDYFTLDTSGADKDHPLSEHKKGLLTIRGSTSSRSSVIFDMDGDGDLDIVTNEQNDRPQVLVSNLSEKHPIHFVKIKLIGTKSNRDGLGAIVKVNAGGRSLTQQHDGKSGYLGQSSMPLYFGLGSATQIDEIEIRWPSGIRQLVKDHLTPNRQIEITEKAGP